ncbi:MAG: hypothetical protein WA421_04730 [Nitrososphaeraceae archaeon]|jgi:hypothetical protein
MGRLAAIYLAHLNPLTKAHENVLSFLAKDYNVYVFPVRFFKSGKEINTRSFPFSYKIRKAMVESVFSNNNNITILPHYTIFSPFIKYLPPLISPYSWMLRNQIVRSVREEKFISYTGDRTERIVLKSYKLHPIRAKRYEISSHAVKELLYHQAIEGRGGLEEGRVEKASWHDKVPEKVIDLIKDNWRIVEEFAKSPDLTLRIMGMKFPKDGFI